jgi:hypothetical protein
LQHLYESLRFKSFHVHRIPHLLTGNLRRKWKEYARTILPFLHAAEWNGWHHFVTSYKS